ncbi:MAG: NAD(P)/FAD-dependent oxidoreductase [Coriobacteriales bacterium]|nr:NAD(P)/FAD-dependent oxidoreductase [Coriobacteriales bacterium]
MANKFPLLTSPIVLGRTTFRNRMFAAPVGATDITADCAPGRRTPPFYEIKAKGGAAAVTASELVVHPETDGSHMLHLDLQTPGLLAAHTWTADAISRHGAVATLEFSHSGQYAGTYLIDKDKKQGLCQWGPSDTTRPDGIPVKALSKEQIADIVQRYGETAKLAMRAGYGMIMVHGGHSWLLNQFISPWFNKRTDEYGGSFENRMRFPLEILQSVRDAVGPFFPIEFRMSGSELFDGGYDLAEGCKIAHAVEDLVDMVHVSAGSYQFGFFNTHLPMFAPHGDNVYLAEEIKKHVDIPVATIGALSDPYQMEEILREGKADVIYMARALMADPELPNKVIAGKEDEIEHCLRCFTCMAERPVTQTRRCSINPLIGREIEGLDVPAAPKAKKVLVVGGGIAGLRAAQTAAKRGHNVTLVEAQEKIGGILKCEETIPFKKEMYDLATTLERECISEGVEIKLGTKADAKFVEGFAPDALIIAVGSNPIVPPLPGIDKDKVIIVNDLYLHEDEVKDTVAVLGGGLAGCECAVHLNKLGKKVSIVEMRDTLAPDCNMRHRPILMKQIEDGIEVYTCTSGAAISDEGLVCKDKDGKEFTIPAETVICAVGQRPNRSGVDELRGTAPWIREIGDCTRPANITKASYEGYHAGLDV